MTKKLNIVLIALLFSFTCKAQNSEWINFTTSNSDLPHNTVTSIAIDDVGNKWIGTARGLAKFDGVNWTVYNVENSEIPHNWIDCIAIDQSNNKWIGTDEGVERI